MHIYDFLFLNYFEDHILLEEEGKSVPVQLFTPAFDAFSKEKIKKEDINMDILAKATEALKIKKGNVIFIFL